MSLLTPLFMLLQASRRSAGQSEVPATMSGSVGVLDSVSEDFDTAGQPAASMDQSEDAATSAAHDAVTASMSAGIVDALRKARIEVRLLLHVC